MSKYTQGPWALLPEECDKPYIRIRGTALGGRYKIANVLTPVYENVPAREAEETRANARLIASAPELLEALEKLLERYVQLVNSGDAGNWNPELEDEVIQARDAIARANGETQ